MQHFCSHHFTAYNIHNHYVAFNLVLKSNLQSFLIKAHRCAEHNTSLSGVSPLCHLFLCPASSVELPAGLGWCVCFGSHASTKNRGQLSIPALIHLFSGAQCSPPIPSAPACTCLGGWCVGLCPAHGTPAEGAYWRKNRLVLSVPDGHTPTTLICAPSFSSLSLSLSLGNDNPCLHLCNTNCHCVVELREWQKPLLFNLYRKAEVMLSVILFLGRIRAGFSPLALFW